MMSLPLSFPVLFGPPRLYRVIAVGALAFLLAACASRAPAPVEDRGIYVPRPGAPPPAMLPLPELSTPADTERRAPTYTVKRGDTLYAIALDHGLDYRELASWNNIENINLIRIGQVLRLSAPGDGDGTAASAGVITTPLRTAPPVVAGDGRPPPPPVARNSDNYKSHPKAVKEPYSEQALREAQRLAAAPAGGPAPADNATPIVARAPEPKAEVKPEPKLEPKSESRAPSAATDDDAKINWLWPTEGKIITGFSDTENLKGIDIAGKTGQPILAAAAGKVVYAGTGLRGYGKLIIVKHNNSFLSAYAHNKDILVKEGQQVTRGQKIAEMGNTDSDQVKLHFEIRRLGKPIDPLKFLPPA